VREETLAIVIRGHPASLRKAERMLKAMLDLRVVHIKRSTGRLWVHEERRQHRHKHRRYEPEADEEPVYIDGARYPRGVVEAVTREWRDSYIIH